MPNNVKYILGQIRKLAGEGDEWVPPPPPARTAPAQPAPPAPPPAASGDFVPPPPPKTPAAPPSAPAAPPSAPAGATGSSNPATPPAAPSAPAGGTGPARPARPTTSGRPISGGATSASAQKAIKEMQMALQVFASTAINYHTKKDPRSGRLTTISLTPQQGPTQQPPQNFKDFNDFITLNYLNSSPIRGNEWSADPSADTEEEKNPVYDDQLIEMDKVVDNLGRIGHSPSERDKDGQWEWRTQNSLRDCYAFGDAILRLSEDFDALDSIRRLFTLNDLRIMRNQIPSNDELAELNAAQKISKANKLTVVLGKLTKFYLAFSNVVTKHPAYRRFTQQENRTPLWVQQPSRADVRDPGDTSQYEDLNKQKDNLYLYNMRVYARDGAPRPLAKFPLSALEKPYMLTDILTQYGWLANEIDNTVKIAFLKDIMKQIDERMAYLKDPRSNPNPEMPLIQGPNSPFAPGGPLAPMSPAQTQSATQQGMAGRQQYQQDTTRIQQEDAARGIQPGTPWGWTTGPDTRSWTERVLRDRSAPPPPIGRTTK